MACKTLLKSVRSQENLVFLFLCFTSKILVIFGKNSSSFEESSNEETEGGGGKVAAGHCNVTLTLNIRGKSPGPYLFSITKIQHRLQSQEVDFTEIRAKSNC